ncbi:heavy-metal-associated domain-containing protein [uncultured Aliiroseovarius sp.]|uniref:heavy-metal-associated domain-containing protein n=1 Tax=uncultured Aliiroseovarius sp. TaxID=1658783 RepID=UPI002592234A|nr:heavy-metal-associated domain-containing protein [uncultured Aliiroseovarius sp.]
MSTFHIPDMNCGHCKASITEALTQAGADRVTFDMTARTIEVSGLSTEAILIKLDEIGFTASPK